jgi:hypothetical protein
MISSIWSKLTPKEIWGALKSRPKIAGSWHGDKHFFWRADPDGKYVAHAQFDGIAVPALELWTPKDQAYVDERLKAAGWILL